MNYKKFISMICLLSTLSLTHAESAIARANDTVDQINASCAANENCSALTS